MLGHQLWRHLHPNHEVWVTLRQSLEKYQRYGLFEAERTVTNVDVSNDDVVAQVFRKVRPEAVINCVGIIKQLREAADPVVSIAINSLLPHTLPAIAPCRVRGWSISARTAFFQVGKECIPRTMLPTPGIFMDRANFSAKRTGRIP